MEDVIEEILGTEIEDETDDIKMHMIHSHPSSTDIHADSHNDQSMTSYGSPSPGHPRHPVWNTKLLRDMDFARLKALHDNMAIMNKDTDLLLSVLRHLESHAPQLKENLLQRARYYFSGTMASALGKKKEGSTKATIDDGKESTNEDHSLLLDFMKQQAEVISINRKTESSRASSHHITATVATESNGLTKEHSVEVIINEPLANSSNKDSTNDSHLVHSAKFLNNVPAEDILYRRGKISTSCLIITEGFVKVIPGKKIGMNEIVDNNHEVSSEEGVPYLLGPYSILGQEALLAPEGTYIPDFTAVVDSAHLKFVRISSFTVTAHSIHESGWSNLMKKKQEDLYFVSLQK